MSKYYRPKNSNKILSDGIEFNKEIIINSDKKNFGAIRKIRTIDEEDYQVVLGVGANKSSRMEFLKSGAVVSSIEARSDGKIYNGKTGRQLAENPTGYTSVTKTDYIDGTVDYIQIGNLVIVKFDDVTIKKDITANRTVLATGLPKPTAYIKTVIINHDTAGSLLRIAIDTDGKIKNHYSNKTASSNNYYGTLIYLTSD